MMTTRDIDIVEFLDEYKVARTSTLAEIFFPSIHSCYNRLSVLSENRLLHRSRDFITNEFIYHKKKLPKQLTHSLLVSDFYRELHKRCKVISFKIEVTMDNMRPDAVFGYSIGDKNYFGILEVEISHKGFNYGKYERFYSSEAYKTYLPVMPVIFVVGDRVKLPDRSSVHYKVINTDFSNFIL
jgi:hypothetical protein